MSLGEIIVSLALVALLYGGFILYLSRLLNTSKLPRNYPTLDDATSASDEQIVTWWHSLPNPRRADEFEAINYICKRYIQITEGGCYQPVIDRTGDAPQGESQLNGYGRI